MSTVPSNEGVSKLDAVEWLHGVMRELTKRDPLTPKISKQLIERWVTDLHTEQFTKLQKHVNSHSDAKAELIKEVFPHVALVVSRFYATKATIARQQELADDFLNNKLRTMLVTVKTATTFQERAGVRDAHGLCECGDIITKIRFQPSVFFRDVNVHETPVRRVVASLNSLSAGRSPLETIIKYLTALVSEGADTTGLLLEHYRSTVGLIVETVRGARIPIVVKNTRGTDFRHQLACQMAWHACDVTSMCILALATSSHKLKSIVSEPTAGGINPLLVGGLYIPGIEVDLIPSASLAEPYKIAKHAALGTEKKTTLLLVMLCDVLQGYCEMEPFAKALERQGIYREDLVPFNHTFLLGVGPEGVVLFQSFLSWGPRLHEYIAGGGLKVRTWAEGDDFVDTFEEFAKNDVERFNHRKNQLYRKMFGLDLLDLIANPMTCAKTMMPWFRSWVDVRVLEDVKSGDVLKFDWRLDNDKTPQPKSQGVTINYLM